MENLDNRRDFGMDSSDEEIYSKAVRAGRRTYFFDVKATRGDDYYVTITESRKKTGRDGSTFFEKQKMHLYKEDFEKFTEGLQDVLGYIDNAKSPQIEETESMSIDEEFDKL